MQLSGFLKRWKHASLPLSMSIYLDVLSPLCNMSLSFQKDRNDPVKAFRRVQDFTWNMANTASYRGQPGQSEQYYDNI